jgi:hypothetical protein
MFEKMFINRRQFIKGATWLSMSQAMGLNSIALANTTEYGKRRYLQMYRMQKVHVCLQALEQPGS